MKYVKPVKLYESLFKRSLRLKENPDLIPPLMAMNIDEDDVSFAHALHCKTVTHLGTVRMNDNNMRPVLVFLQKLVSILNPKYLIVGYPFFDSMYKPNAEETQNFIDYLRKSGLFEGLKYTYWDKHLTPKEKENNLTYLLHLCRHQKGNLYLQSNSNASSLNILKVNPTSHLLIQI
ncbi:hypothetical protein Ddye_007085 [Dipteronia dyeriana]|uniref:Uncharacterized protein n=1 Tax=Dipteronia dyeriana TaxID=168575 RepID=A0AAE0CRA5_9ROSI|nr:hypothetical protein Ddye_007085 [Dipteronia dyeriana]